MKFFQRKKKALTSIFKYTAIGMYFDFCFDMALPFYSSFFLSLGYTEVGVSWLMAMYPLGLIFLGPVIGKLSDRYGRKRMIHIGYGLLTMSMAIYFTSDHWIALSLARVLDATAVAAVLLVALARVEDSMQSGKRGAIAGWYFSSRTIVQLIAPVVAGFLADSFFLRAPFLLSFALAGIFSLALFFIRDQEDEDRLKKNPHKHKHSVFNEARAMRQFLAHRTLRGVAILGMTTHASQLARVVFLPILVHKTLGYPFAFVGYAFFVFGFPRFFQFAFGRLADRFGAARFIVIGSLIMGIGFGLLGLVSDYAYILFVLLIMGIGNGLWNISAWTYMSEIGEREKREGQFVTCYMSLAKIGAVVMSLVAGIIVIKTSISFLFLISATLVLFGSVSAYIHLRPVINK